MDIQCCSSRKEEEEEEERQESIRVTMGYTSRTSHQSPSVSLLLLSSRSACYFPHASQTKFHVLSLVVVVVVVVVLVVVGGGGGDNVLVVVCVVVLLLTLWSVM